MVISLIEPQQILHRKIQTLIGPGAASFFKDACLLMQGEIELESTTHFVGHALREIESSLRNVLLPLSYKKEQCKSNASTQEMRDILNSLKILQTDENYIKLLHIAGLADQYQEEKSKNTHKDQIQSILKVLEISEDNDIAQNWLKLSERSKEYGLHKRAHRNDLATTRPVDKDFRTFWNDIQEVLNSILNAFEAHFAEVRNTLDELLQNPSPTKKDVSSLRLKVPNSNSALGYFFKHLQHPQWLDQLNIQGFFENYPEPDNIDEIPGRSHPSWPQTGYLLRMLKHEEYHQKIFDITLVILRQKPVNAKINAELTEIALAVSPKLSAQLAELMAHQFCDQNVIYNTNPEKLGELCVYLAHNSQEEAAEFLLKELLTLKTNASHSYQRSRIKYDEDIDSYLFVQILKNTLPRLLSSLGLNVIVILCDLLQASIEHSNLYKENSEYLFPNVLYEIVDSQNFHYDIDKNIINWTVRSFLSESLRGRNIPVPQRCGMFETG